ncbi:unnamed protein product [Lepidochelys kempii]
MGRAAPRTWPAKACLGRVAHSLDLPPGAHHSQSPLGTLVWPVGLQIPACNGPLRGQLATELPEPRPCKLQGCSCGPSAGEGWGWLLSELPLGQALCLQPALQEAPGLGGVADSLSVLGGVAAQCLVSLQPFTCCPPQTVLPSDSGLDAWTGGLRLTIPGPLQTVRLSLKTLLLTDYLGAGCHGRGHCPQPPPVSPQLPRGRAPAASPQVSPQLLLARALPTVRPQVPPASLQLLRARAPLAARPQHPRASPSTRPQGQSPPCSQGVRGNSHCWAAHTALTAPEKQPLLPLPAVADAAACFLGAGWGSGGELDKLPAAQGQSWAFISAPSPRGWAWWLHPHLQGTQERPKKGLGVMPSGLLLPQGAALPCRAPGWVHAAGLGGVEAEGWWCWRREAGHRNWAG